MRIGAVHLLLQSHGFRRKEFFRQQLLFADSLETWSGRSKIYQHHRWNTGFLCEINRNHCDNFPHIFPSSWQGMHSQAGRIYPKQQDHDKPVESSESSYASRKLNQFRPLLVLFRATYILAEVTMLSMWHFLLKDVQVRAEKLRRCLIRLGPFYIKLGQALSTRPDLLPSAYCQELAKLQDQIPPFPTSAALQYIESQLGSRAEELFLEISPEPIAAASLGQVYKARLYSGELVAVKVQRPGMQSRLALDSYLVHIVGVHLRLFLGARSDIVAAVNEMVERMFEEIDYIKEGQNAERFAALYGKRSKVNCTDVETTINSGGRVYTGYWAEKTSLKRRTNISEVREEWGLVKVPNIYWNLSNKGVLTMEWIDGIKLTDRKALQKLNFDVHQLIDQGVFCSLRQVLEEGFFHADPHPGNLVVTRDGVLAYFDFGMMGEFPREYRIGFIRTLVHFVNRDSIGLANDFVALGFVPEGASIEEIGHALRASFGDESSKARLDFQGIMNQLSNVMYTFNFTLPPTYALVIRALGSLEGTATLLDPEFKVVSSAYPFIIGRLLADPDPDMRQILRELLIRNNGSIRWHRLERLVVAIAEQSSTPSSSWETKKEGVWAMQDGLGKMTGIRGSSFNTRTVISATSDLLEFVLSEQGYRTRVLMVQDIVRSLNDFLDEHVLSHSYSQSSTKDATSLSLSSRQNFHEDMESTLSAGSQQAIKMHARAGSKQFKEFKQRASMWTKKGAKGQPEQNLEYVSRIVSGLSAFRRAMGSAPELWITMLARLSIKPEAQKLVATIIASLLRLFCLKGSEAIWLLLSRIIHEIYRTEVMH